MADDNNFMTPEIEDSIIDAAIKMGMGDFPFDICWLDEDNNLHYHTIG